MTRNHAGHLQGQLENITNAPISIAKNDLQNRVAKEIALAEADVAREMKRDQLFIVEGDNLFNFESQELSLSAWDDISSSVKFGLALVRVQLSLYYVIYTDSWNKSKLHTYDWYKILYTKDESDALFGSSEKLIILTAFRILFETWKTTFSSSIPANQEEVIQALNHHRTQMHLESLESLAIPALLAGDKTSIRITPLFRKRNNTKIRYMATHNFQYQLYVYEIIA
ncbi:hypothetical protein ACJX0J_023876 [Zea mays]